MCSAGRRRVLNGLAATGWISPNASVSADHLKTRDADIATTPLPCITHAALSMSGGGGGTRSSNTRAGDGGGSTHTLAIILDFGSGSGHHTDHSPPEGPEARRGVKPSSRFHTHPWTSSAPCLSNFVAGHCGSFDNNYYTWRYEKSVVNCSLIFQYIFFFFCFF